MSLLSDISISRDLIADRLQIAPFMSESLQPNSYDVRLGPDLLIQRGSGDSRWHLIDDGPLELRQLDFVLGATLERLTLSGDIAAFLAGKSSLARKGIQVESAGLIDAGWDGQLTLEIVHLSPRSVTLTAGMLIGQVYFVPLTTPALRPYGHPDLRSRYQHSVGPVASRDREVMP